ncbi:MAG TPA: glycosyl transferase, partial [Haliea salexigens]|nr:glycosyl transferase [Haliea salexigens]
YSPLKVYFPLSVLLAGLGLANYLLGAFGSGLLRFSNMSSLLLLAGLVVFFIGLIAEQLTNLQYKDIDHDLD